MSFDFDSLVNFIKENNNISVISIQFSPEYQKDFQEDFYEKIKKLLPKEKNIYIIGDTSYSKCCCDEVTAMHLKSDIILRVGNSCFTQNKTMPIYYLLNNLDFSEEQISQFKNELFNILDNQLKADDKTENLIIFYKEDYQQNLINKIKNNISTEIFEKYKKKVIFAYINIIDYDKETKNKIIYNEHPLLYGRQLIPILKDNKIDNTCSLIYIGDNTEDPLLTELSLRFCNTVNNMFGIFYNKDKQCFEGQILPKTFSSKLLYRRFNLIEIAKECSTFGILIGSLSIPNLNRIIDLIKSLLESQERKVYTLLLGKITDEKLANFTEYIDAFVLIGCPFNQGYNAKAIDKPIMSPLDIKYAFDENYSWDGFYSFDVDYILINDKEIKEQLENIKIQKEKEIEKIQIKINKENLQSIQKIESNQALAPIFSLDIIEKYENRRFKGLEINNDDPEINEIRKVIKGKRGIPIKYEKIQ